MLNHGEIMFSFILPTCHPYLKKITFHSNRIVITGIVRYLGLSSNHYHSYLLYQVIIMHSLPFPTTLVAFLIGITFLISSHDNDPYRGQMVGDLGTEIINSLFQSAAA